MIELKLSVEKTRMDKAVLWHTAKKVSGCIFRNRRFSSGTLAQGTLTVSLSEWCIVAYCHRGLLQKVVLSYPGPVGSSVLVLIRITINGF